MGLVHGVNTRPLVCRVSSARSADAREARFLVELYVIIVFSYVPYLVFNDSIDVLQPEPNQLSLICFPGKSKLIRYELRNVHSMEFTR